MYLRAAARPFARIPRLARAVAGVAPRVLDIGANLMELSQDWRAQGGQAMLSQLSTELRAQLRASLQRAPHTRFSAPVSPHRAIEVVKLPIDDIGIIRAAFAGVTLNDVLVATVGGALHRYLAHTQELPQQSLIAQVPISLRLGSAGDGRDGNVVSAVLMPIHSEISDPAARLRAVHAGAAQAKSAARRLGVELLPRLVHWVPGRVAELVAEKFLAPLMNLVISNVRGSERPLYLAGARAVALIPLSIVVDGVGLNLTANSYAGNVWISILSCRSMMPDPEFFAACMRKSFAELIEVAGGSSKPAADASHAPHTKPVRRGAASAKRQAVK
jgi:WS/DGAT/MGAT family acyltransferase